MITRPLTETELEVIFRLANGEHVKQIAYSMGTTLHSVYWSIRTAKEATNTQKDTHLVATAFRMGWIE